MAVQHRDRIATAVATICRILSCPPPPLSLWIFLRARVDEGCCVVLAPDPFPKRQVCIQEPPSAVIGRGVAWRGVT